MLVSVTLLHTCRRTAISTNMDFIRELEKKERKFGVVCVCVRISSNHCGAELGT